MQLSALIFGLIMMSTLTLFVLQFTSDPNSTCKDTSDTNKCLSLMSGMKNLIYVSWPVYIIGIIVLNLLAREGKKPNQTFDAGWEPKQPSDEAVN